MLIASLVFFFFFSVSGIFVMIGTALITFFAGLGVQKLKDEYEDWRRLNRATVDKQTIKEKKSALSKKTKMDRCRKHDYRARHFVRLQILRFVCARDQQPVSHKNMDC